MDHLRGLISNVCEDSTISKCIKCARTKGTGVFQAVFGKHYLDELIVTLKKCKFSLIIDKTTDISIVKQLVLICRYYDSTLRKTVDKYLALISVTDCSASEIVKSLLNFFEKHAIPFDNLIRFASDNASVMMG